MSRQLRYTKTRGQAGNPSDKVATPEEVIELVMREAQRRGIKNFQPHMAAGIVGSLMQESGNFRRDVISQQLRGDDGTAYGAAQWRNDRKSNLDKFLKQRGLSANSLEGQISFVFEEMDKTSPFRDSGAVRAMNGIMNSNNISQAATEFIHFERPAGYGVNKRNPALSAHDRTKRINHAQNAFNSFSGSSTGSDQMQTSSAPKGNVKFEYFNEGAIRNKPIDPKLKQAIINAANQTGGISRVLVFSGGQDGKGQGKRRTGSVRHDHGGAADTYIYDMNNNLIRPDNPKYQKILGSFVSNAKRNGITGIGAGDGYMGGTGIHLGYGKPSVWGAKGKSANAPEWLKAAYNGTEVSNSNSENQSAMSYNSNSMGYNSTNSSQPSNTTSNAKEMLARGGMGLFNQTPKLNLQFGEVNTGDLQSGGNLNETEYQNEDFVENMQMYNNLGYYS